MRADFLVDTVFIAVYAPLLWHAWQWLRTKERQGPPSPLRSLTLAGSPYPRAVPITVLAAAHLGGSPVGFVALGFLVLVAVESAWRNRDRWVREHLWALGRLRVPAVTVALVAAMVVFGDTRSLRDPGIGLAMWVAVLAMGASVWFVARRLVLTSWPQKTWRSARPELGALIRLGLCVLVGAVGWFYGPRQLTGYAVVLGIVVLLGLVWVVWEAEDAEAARSKLGEADRIRARAAMRPGPHQRPAVMRVARGLAVAPLGALVMAYVPMAYDGQNTLTAMRVLVLCAVAVLFGDWLMARGGKQPWHSPHHWWFTAVLVTVSAASLVAVGMIGRTLPLAVVFLMFGGLLLSEAQRFAETVPVPKGLLFLGFTRTPVALLIALCLVANGVSYPTDAVESWSTNLRQVVRMASTVMAFEPAST
ncbi:hypothetical protein [Lentzea flava]|uniref:Uncharacterized protein n=1 Tax=Lentzea flava TaxID=103732 RepID=A0ABQ2UIM0_9PSEU|nr:hypothetical protein [Lentzea flava]MCP2199766.1 hypothetical protein [Lentzea flava]GGU38462.1 hypothetical protein GCM10010178_33430 [Lentzea flava]